MPSPYTGNPVAVQAPSPAPGRGVDPIIVLPIDGDAGNAASIYQAFKCLADNAAWINNHAAILDDGTPNDFTNQARWFGGVLPDNSYRLGFGPPIGDRANIESFAHDLADGMSYTWNESTAAGGGISTTANARFDSSIGQWRRVTAAALPSMLLRIRGSELRLGYSNGTVATWADGAWQAYAGLIPYVPPAGAPANGLQSEGPVLVARTATGTAIPAATVTAGEVYRDDVPIGRYRCDWTGGVASIKRARGIKSHTRTGAGKYEIILWPVLSDPAGADVQVQAVNVASPDVTILAAVSDAGGADAGRVKVTLECYTLGIPAIPAGGAPAQWLQRAAVDLELSMVVWA